MDNPHVVFCDSYEALNKLYENGLPKNTKIITKSPTILNSKNLYVQNLEEYTNNSYQKQFQKNSKILTYEIFNSLKKDKNYSEYSALIAYNFLKFYNKIYFGSLFKDDYLKKKFWVIQPTCMQKSVNKAVSSEIYSILEKHPKCEVKKIDVNITKERSPRGESNVSVFTRLGVVGFKGIFWHFINIISLLFKNNKFKVAIISSNELVRDISYYLLWKKNIKLFHYKNFFNNKSFKIKNTKNNHLSKKIHEVINKIFIKSLNDVSSDNVKSLLISNWDLEITEIVNTYHSYKFSFKNFLNSNKINIIFFGYLDMVRGLALHKICKDKNISLVSCQHGITREIIYDPDLRSIFFETSFSDYFFCYNNMSKKVTKDSIYAGKNNIYSIGLPSDYKNFNSKNIMSKKVCYVSTILLSGGIPNLIAPEPDINLIKWELNLINKVFKKIANKIYYKPYPAIRYAEDDITIKAVIESNNLEIVGSHIDFRYIISNYGLLITSVATSTLGWCVQSNIPLVFINRKGSLSIKKSVLNDFEKAFFVFDDSNINWDKLLKIFLEKNFVDMLKLWDSMSSYRSIVIKKYFGDVNINSGKNGAELINKLIKSNTYGNILT